MPEGTDKPDLTNLLNWTQFSHFAMNTMDGHKVFQMAMGPSHCLSSTTWKDNAWPDYLTRPLWAVLSDHHGDGKEWLETENTEWFQYDPSGFKVLVTSSRKPHVGQQWFLLFDSWSLLHRDWSTVKGYWRIQHGPPISRVEALLRRRRHIPVDIWIGLRVSLDQSQELSVHDLSLAHSKAVFSGNSCSLCSFCLVSVLDGAGCDRVSPIVKRSCPNSGWDFALNNSLWSHDALVRVK